MASESRIQILGKLLNKPNPKDLGLRPAGSQGRWNRLGIGLGFALMLALTWLIAPADTRVDVSAYALGEPAPHDIKSDREFSIEDRSTTLGKQQEAELAMRSLYDHDDLVPVRLTRQLRDAFDIGVQANDAYERLRQGMADAGETGASPEAAGNGARRSQERRNGRRNGTPDRTSATAARPPVSPPAILSAADTLPSLAEALGMSAEAFQLRTGMFWERTRVSFEKRVGVDVPKELFATLRSAAFAPELLAAIVEPLTTVYQVGVVTDKDAIAAEMPKGIVARYLGSREERLILRADRVLSLSEANEVVRTSLRERFRDRLDVSQALADLADRLLAPNLTPNRQETETRRDFARAAVEPVYYQVKKGEMIVREGERITETTVMKLQAMHRQHHGGAAWLFSLGIFLIVMLILGYGYSYLMRFRPNLAMNHDKLALLGTITLLHMIVLRAMMWLAEMVAASQAQFPFNQVSSYYFALPYAVGPLLVALLVDQRVAVLFSTVYAVFAGLVTGNNFEYTLAALVGSYAAVFSVAQYRQRTAITRAGLLIAVFNALVIVNMRLGTGMSPLQLELFGGSWLFDCLCGLVGGLLVAFVVQPIIIGLENAFQLTTDARLLELSNLDQPLLRELIMKAPGTYQHSLAVGNLAEAAAETIGGNSLFARVASYYHDIGKMSKPHYFVENLAGRKNPHEKLKPNLSARIIINHVKEGVKLAREYKLGEPIIDIILEHHGTSLLYFFYKKACMNADSKVRAVNEEEFRYPGPRPRTKESAIIMIADSVEAASRTLANPTHARLKGLVRRIVADKFEDGQFELSTLSLTDLSKIQDAMVHVLTGIYHHRLNYPGIDFEPDKSKKRRAEQPAAEAPEAVESGETVGAVAGADGDDGDGDDGDGDGADGDRADVLAATLDESVKDTVRTRERVAIAPNPEVDG
ncbi:MAG: HDIG domain-containing protein [Candidatus Schekmanbacteria bacterium]|nr:HDIG domain-containing protein [Candidatus Schekmanbacteria bacterium]